MLANEGKYDESIICIDEALKRYPNNEAFLLTKASTFEKAKRFESAIEIYKRIIDYKPESMNGFMGMARVLEKLGRNVEAKNYRDELKIRANPDTNPHMVFIDPQKGLISSIIEKAETLANLGRLTDALNVIYSSLSQFGNNEHLLALKTNIVLRSGNTHYAKNICEDLIKSNSNFYPAYIVKGNALAREGNLKGALKCFNTVLSIENVPKEEQAEVWLGMGNAFNGMGNLKKAINCLDKALNINPNFAEALLIKGNALLNMGNLKEGGECLHKALALKPSLKRLVY